MPVVSNGFYNDPQLGAAFSNIASLFAPPSGSDINAYAQAALARQKLGTVADLYANPNQPDFDRRAIAAGLETGATSLYGVDQGNAAKRYEADSLATTQRMKDAQDNQRSNLQFFNAPIRTGPNESVTVSPLQQQAENLPSQTISGPTTVNAGQTYIPAGGGAPIYGTKTKDQVEAEALAGLTKPALQNLAMTGPGTENIVDPITGKTTVQSKAGAIGQVAAPPMNNTYETTDNRNIAGMRDEVRKAAQGSIGEAPELQTLVTALNDPNVTTGALAQHQLTLQRAANSIGINGGDTSPAELVNAIGSKIALASRTEGGRNLLPGNMTDRDADMLLRMGAGLSNSPETNRILTQMYIGIAQKNIDMEKASEDYEAKNPGALGPGYRSMIMGRSLLGTMYAPQQPVGANSNGQQQGGSPDAGNAPIKAGAANPSISTSAAVPDIEKAPSFGAQSSVPTVSSPADAAKLPPGTPFRTPDGRLLRVPNGR